MSQEGTGLKGVGGISPLVIREKTSYEKLKDAAKILQPAHPDIKLNAGEKALVQKIRKYDPSLLPVEFRNLSLDSLEDLRSVSPIKSTNISPLTPPTSPRGRRRKTDLLLSLLSPSGSTSPLRNVRTIRTISPTRSIQAGGLENFSISNGMTDIPSLVPEKRGRGRPRKESSLTGVLERTSAISPAKSSISGTRTGIVPVTSSGDILIPQVNKTSLGMVSPKRGRGRPRKDSGLISFLERESGISPTRTSTLPNSTNIMISQATETSPGTVSPKRGRPPKSQTYIPGKGITSVTPAVDSDIVFNSIPLVVPSPMTTLFNPIGIPVSTVDSTVGISSKSSIISPRSLSPTFIKINPLGTPEKLIASPSRLQRIETIEGSRFKPRSSRVDRASPLRNIQNQSRPIMPPLLPLMLSSQSVSQLPLASTPPPKSLLPPVTSTLSILTPRSLMSSLPTPTSMILPTSSPTLSSGKQIDRASIITPNPRFLPTQGPINLIPQATAGGDIAARQVTLPSFLPTKSAYGDTMLQNGGVIPDEDVIKGFRLPNAGPYNLGHEVIVLGQRWVVVQNENTGYKIWRLHLPAGAPHPSVKGYILGDTIMIGTDKYRIEKPGRKKVWIKFN